MQRSDEFRVPFRRSSGLSFIADLSPDTMMPLQFGEFLGNLEYEHARMVLLFLGDVFRYSMSAAGSRCPYCPIELHAFHLFSCPNSPFRDSLPSWQSFIASFHAADWSSFITILFLCLQQWTRGSNFFQSKVRDRVGSFLGLPWSRTVTRKMKKTSEYPRAGWSPCIALCPTTLFHLNDLIYMKFWFI